MSVGEGIRLAFRSIASNKMRAFLTMLGIIIGISAVIMITTIGATISTTINNAMRSLGNTSLAYCYITNRDLENPTDRTITFDMLQRYRQEFSDRVDAVEVESYLGDATVAGVKEDQTCTVIASTPGYLTVNTYEMVAGRDLSNTDVDEERPTALISDTFAVAVFGEGANPLGQSFTMTLQDGSAAKAYVVGVYHQRPNGMFGSGSNPYVIIPITSAADFMSQTTGSYGYTDFTEFYNFTILVNASADPNAVASETKEWFDANYFENTNTTLDTYTMASQLSSINQVISVITIAVSIIAGISLIVGGVGVMNIMLVSVAERTREIGIRKALGAKNGSIRLQFLLEAVVLCVIGGLIGIGLGILMGYALGGLSGIALEQYASEISSLVSLQVTPSFTAIIVSFLFSAAIGIVFGYYPANRAAKMSPIDALRYE